MDGTSIITNIVFGFTGLWLLFQLIQRLATVEEELIDMRYELKAARRNVETLDMIVNMQREQLEARAAAEPVEAAEELEEGEVREPTRGRTRHR